VPRYALRTRSVLPVWSPRHGARPPGIYTGGPVLDANDSAAHATEVFNVFDESRDEDVFSMTGSLEALRELEQCTGQAIVQQRASERLEIHVKVTIRPANASERHRLSIDGLTENVSEGGCMILLPRPIMAGDLFWLAFDDADVTIGSLYALCLRCRRVQEDTFEAGFRFFDNIELASTMVDQERP
jgi:hypothetical protein